MPSTCTRILTCLFPWRKFRIRIHSELIRIISESVSESMRINSNKIFNPVRWKSLEYQSVSIRFNPRLLSEWTRIKFSNWMNQNQSQFRLIQNVSESMQINPNQSEKKFSIPFAENCLKIIPIQSETSVRTIRKINPSKSERNRIKFSNRIWTYLSRIYFQAILQFSTNEI